MTGQRQFKILINIGFFWNVRYITGFGDPKKWFARGKFYSPKSARKENPNSIAYLTD